MVLRYVFTRPWWPSICPRLVLSTCYQLHQWIHFVFMNIDAEIGITFNVLAWSYTLVVSYMLRFYYFYHKITIIPVEILIRVRISTVIICLRTRFLVGRYFVYVHYESFIGSLLHLFAFVILSSSLVRSYSTYLLDIHYTMVSGIQVSEAMWLSSSYFLNCIQGLNSSLFLFGLLE